MQGHEPVFVILDGDHSHENVLFELEMLDEYLPAKSIVLVADTMLEEVEQTGKERNWNTKSNPGTALREFMVKRKNWSHLPDFCNKVVMSEAPMGWVEKIY